MRSLKKGVTIKIGPWLVTERKGSWNVRGEGTKFCLRERMTGSWNLSFRSTNGSRVSTRTRKRFDSPTLETAIERAVEFIPGLKSPTQEKTIAEVLAWWVSTMACGEETLRDYHTWNKFFIRWCGRNGLLYWRELDWDHLQLYANELARKCLSKRTIQAYTFPVRSASTKAAHKWRDAFHDFATGYSAPKNAKGRRRQSAKNLDWVCRFLMWLRNTPAGWDVIIGVALQGLCGLRVTEVLRLTWDRVDLVHGLIMICTQPTKNEQSVRTIPIPMLVLEVLRAAPQNSDRVVSAFSTISSWRNALSGRKVKKGRAREVVFIPGFMDRFESGSGIPPKDLRNTLASERRKRLWNKEAMESYYGHRGRKVIDEHYTHLDEDELIEILRREVVEKVDEVVSPYLESWRSESSKVVQLTQGQGHLGNVWATGA